MSASNEKGARRERECIKRLKREGWYPMKAPASGSATDRELPDVVAGNQQAQIAAEVKTADPSHGNIYVAPEKADDLYVFAKAFNMVALFLVRWDHDMTWYWAEPSDVPVTPSGRYRLDPAVCHRDWWTLADLDEILQAVDDF